MTEATPVVQERKGWLDRPLAEIRLPRELDLPHLIGRFRPPRLAITPDAGQKATIESTGRFDIRHEYKEKVVQPRETGRRQAVPLAVRRPINPENRWQFGRIEADRRVPRGESRLTLRGKKAVLLVHPEEAKGRWSISYGRRKDASGRKLEGMAITVTRKDKPEEGPAVKHQTRVELAPEQLRAIAVKRRVAALAAAATALLLGLAGSGRMEGRQAQAAHPLPPEPSDSHTLHLPEIPQVPGVAVPRPEREVRPSLVESYVVKAGDTLMGLIREALERDYPSANDRTIEVAATALKNYTLATEPEIRPNAEGEHYLTIGQEIELPGRRLMADCMRAVQSGELRASEWGPLALPPTEVPPNADEVIPSRSPAMQAAAGAVTARLEQR